MPLLVVLPGHSAYYMTTISRTQYQQSLQLVESTHGSDVTPAILADAIGVTRATATTILSLIANRHIIADTQISTPGIASTAVVLADTHVPFHNQRNINAAIEYIERTQPNTVVLNGDILDCLSLTTKFSRDPRSPRIEDEIRQTKSFLDAVRAATPRARIVFIEGNHEQRLTRYAQDKAPDLIDLIENLIPQRLDLADRGIEYIRGYITLGKLYVMHGHEIKGSGSGDLCRIIWSKTYNHTLVGHFHRTRAAQYHTISGESFIVSAIGCLCNPQPYDSLPQWDSSIAEITIRSDQTFTARSIPIVNGEIF